MTGELEAEGPARPGIYEGRAGRYHAGAVAAG